MSKKHWRKRFLIMVASLGVSLLIASIGGQARAQTPDEMTPAEEDVCGGLTGPAFGLCNAYCEAMDCDDVGYAQHSQACDTVLGNYQKVTPYAGPTCDCGDVCLTLEDECSANCGDDEECVLECCRNATPCFNDCCTQRQEQQEVLRERCIKACKGDAECIAENGCDKRTKCIRRRCRVIHPE